MKKIFALALALAALPFALPRPAGAFGEPPPVTPRIALPFTSFMPGQSYPVLLELDIKEGFHINSDKPLDPSLIPTVATFSATGGGEVSVGRVTYPEPELLKFKFADEKLSVYQGKVYIATSISFTEGGAGPYELKARLGYQACTDVSCLIPVDAEVTAQLAIGPGGVPLEPDLFKKHGASAAGEKTDFFAGLKGGLTPAALFFIFLGGLALNLTPCVYPMIPVTIGYFGGHAGKTRRETAAHAAVYLLGMAVMYSALGVGAALTGALFGGYMQNPAVVALLVAVMLGLSAGMFGAYDVVVPQGLLKLSTKSYAGFFGSFFMGLTVGILAAPCVGPFVIGLLTFVGERGDPLLGFGLFFVLALGLGLPLVILAMFSGAMALLPRSGVWMVWVKKVFGVVMVGMALYFARPLIAGDAFYGWLSAVTAVAGGAYLLWAGRGIGGKWFALFRWAVPAALVAFGVWVSPATHTGHAEFPFTPYSRAAFENSAKQARPAILDFTADWCVPCRELKIFTFADPRVMEKAKSFDAYAVDLTRADEAELAAKKEFGVLGVPTVILFDATGKETDRWTGFIPADEFLKKLAVAGVK